MQHILYNHPNKTDGYRASNLASTDILRAISLHSIKDIRVFTRVHNFALQRKIMELEQRNMLLRRQIDVYDQILDIQNQIKIQARNFSKLIQKTKNEQIKSKLKQQYKILNMPDQHIAEQIMSLYNNTYKLFINNNNHQQGIDRRL
jgi:outer membrane phospholipase A